MAEAGAFFDQDKIGFLAIFGTPDGKVTFARITDLRKSGPGVFQEFVSPSNPEGDDRQSSTVSVHGYAVDDLPRSLSLLENLAIAVLNGDKGAAILLADAVKEQWLDEVERG